MALPKWLHDARPLRLGESAASSPFGSSNVEMRDRVGYITGRRLVDDLTFGGYDAEIRADGTAAMQRLGAVRAARLLRRDAGGLAALARRPGHTPCTTAEFSSDPEKNNESVSVTNMRPRRMTPC